MDNNTMHLISLQLLLLQNFIWQSYSFLNYLSIYYNLSTEFHLFSLRTMPVKIRLAHTFCSIDS